MRWLGTLVVLMVVAVLGHLISTSTQAQDPAPVRGQYGALYANNDVLRARVSGSHRMADNGSNLSLNHVGDDVQLKAKEGRNLILSGGDDGGSGAGAVILDGMVAETSSTPRYETSTPAGYLWMSGATVPFTGAAPCTSCAAYTLHVFEANSGEYIPLH